MEGARPSISSEELKKLHDCALASKLKLEQTFEEDTLAVAILDHGKTVQDCEQGDFHWFKLKPKHSVGKLKNAYLRKNNVSIFLKQSNITLSDETQMRHLIHLNTIIVLTSQPTDMEQSAPPSSASASTPVRNPLQPINAQLPANANTNPLHPADGKPHIKSETTYSSPYVPEVRPNVLEPRQPAPYGPFQPAVKNEPRDVPDVAWSVPAPSHPQAGVSQTNTPAKAERAVQEHTATEASSSAAPPQPTKNELVQKLSHEGSPEELEAEVRRSQVFLEELKKPMVDNVSQHKDAEHWVKQIENLQKHQVDTPTIIGVVGNTGAGKSSVINAMLEEERLVPTNCMRACTAVVTEMSWNSSDDENSKYRADIEFIKPEDWRKDLELSLSELIDSSGNVSNDCTKPESEAGIAYAKIKAVYPNKTKEDIASSSVAQLMREPGVANVLGTTKNIAKPHSDMFYKALQRYVDSKEKAEKKNKKKDKGDKPEPKTMEFWPLIKVVRIYTKAECLSTGAVIVDLPGVHDSNAARAAVAQGYMKQCTGGFLSTESHAKANLSGLFIVAPINRAVDDKAAKSLLGESFKRQLKFDGTYSRITFICSKTDDISITEAADSLGLDDEMAEDWDKIDDFKRKQKGAEKLLKEMRESKAVYQEVMNDSDDKIEEWEKLKDSLDVGEIVYAPGEPSKKRKRSAGPKKSRKKSKKPSSENDEDDDFIDDDEEEEDEEDDQDEDESENESDSESSSGKGDPLTAEAIDAHLATFKEDKKKARQERLELDKQIRGKTKEVKDIEESILEIEAAISAVCIAGRNKYSKGAIQRDFADGIRELDQEAAQEEDPDQFDPEKELRDYDEVANSLPVFCVSSRAYQKVQGRLQRDKDVPGFRSAEETEVPQLQGHCKKLTEAGRASNCRVFLTNLCQFLNSLGLWATNDGTGLKLTDTQLAAETRFLKTRLQTLEMSLENAVKECLKSMNDALAEHIFENYEQLIELAVQQANKTVARWNSPINRENRPVGGYFWATYKAITRREGMFTNAQGLHDFNAELIEPMIKHLAGHWERAFIQKLPRVLTTFTKESKDLLTAFHREIEQRSMKTGTGAAGLMLLGQQLTTYNQIFTNLTEEMKAVITELQRDANREFTPVIARNLSSAYEYCADEKGGGQYARMRAHMANHVDTTRNNMFAESCAEVKERLLLMCQTVEQTMAARADEVFLCMQRDYMEVISGTALPQGQTMPKWERTMRAQVAKVIEDREKTALQEVESGAKEGEAAGDAEQTPEGEVDESGLPKSDASEAEDDDEDEDDKDEDEDEDEDESESPSREGSCASADGMELS
ncbi:uncharacterized protein PAC_00630 [Phialocephala subalpina]|uniref:Nuclear GTPase SLIP-GC n=1 Tax=Phialocephala subalpina TaxID=576137 RepID=A0A1L7WDB0_9HELO|nr:uncharacterized protein PAC_00630 [Phialocephala subalpina]